MKNWIKGGLIGAGIGLVVSFLIFFFDNSFYNLLNVSRTLYNVFFLQFSFGEETSNLVFGKIVFFLFLSPIILGLIVGLIVGKVKSSPKPKQNKIKPQQNKIKKRKKR